MAVEMAPEATASDGTPIVEIRNLQTTFFTDKETIRAVDGISFDIVPGETVGIVGESGSGKSVTARSLMGLIDSPGAVLEGSCIKFTHLDTVRDYARQFPSRTTDLTDVERDHDAEAILEEGDTTAAQFGYEDPREVPVADLVAAGLADHLDLADEDDCVFVTAGDPDDPASITEGFVEISRLDGEAQRLMRGGRIAMIFQDPLTSLNPVYTVGNQIKEALRLHQGLKGEAATREAAELLEAVGIPDARRRVNEYPHQFSGGMRQRAIIAMALACEPEVLICDEPTTALDVTIQAQILDLLDDIQEARDLAIMFITHDMGVIAEVCDDVNVMYAGEIVESAEVERLFADPKHPYTQGLLESIPGRQSGEKLQTIEGNVPTANERATYCRFAPRCPEAFPACEEVHPVSVSASSAEPDHTAACLLYPEAMDRKERVDYHEQRDPNHDDERDSTEESER